MRLLTEALALTPEEVDFLQKCYDELLSEHGIGKASDDGQAVAKALLAGYGRGVTGETELKRLAMIRPIR